MLYILIETEITAIGKKDSTLSIAFVKDSFCNNLYIPDSKISNEKKKKKKSTRKLLHTLLPRISITLKILFVI